MDLIEILACLVIVLFSLWITGMFDCEIKRADKEYDDRDDKDKQ